MRAKPDPVRILLIVGPIVLILGMCFDVRASSGAVVVLNHPPIAIAGEAYPNPRAALVRVPLSPGGKDRTVTVARFACACVSRRYSEAELRPVNAKYIVVPVPLDSRGEQYVEVRIHENESDTRGRVVLSSGLSALPRVTPRRRLVRN
jgi:hypothetical protein